MTKYFEINSSILNNINTLYFLVGLSIPSNKSKLITKINVGTVYTVY